jgi:hypothetical protein
LVQVCGLSCYGDECEIVDERTDRHPQRMGIDDATEGTACRLPVRGFGQQIVIVREGTRPNAETRSSSAGSSMALAPSSKAVSTSMVRSRSPAVIARGTF